MPGKLGYKQQRTLDYLAEFSGPAAVDYKTAESRRIVDSLVRRRLVDMTPTGGEFVLLSLRPVGVFGGPLVFR